VTNHQGGPLEALDRTGVVTASRLYAPYGASRYSSGSFPTSVGYTGQRADASTGLDYYGARYYDPALGQFTSADTVMDGLNRYGYVGGNPTSATDPSGHIEWAIDPSQIGGWFGNAFAGDPGMAVAGAAAVAAGVGIAAATHSITTTSAIPLAGTSDPSNTNSINDSTVVVTANGDIVVTTQGSRYASTTTSYAPGQAGWVTWDQAINQSLADDTPFNARTAPNSSTTTSVSAPIAVSATAPQAGGGGTGVPGTVGGIPAGTAMPIPTAIPPIGIAVGIGIGITSIEWLVGTLFAKKADLKQLRAAARKAGITDEEDIREFGDWVEWYKHKGGCPAITRARSRNW
jgi:RHS repeat-associated protein